MKKINIKTVKPGDTFYYIPSDTRESPKTLVVEKVGNTIISFKNERFLRFNSKEGLQRSICGEWSYYSGELYLSEDDYKHTREISRKVGYIVNNIGKFSDEDIEFLYEQLKSM